MQKITIVLAAALLIASCNRPHADFEVKAVIKNAVEGQTLSLQKFGLLTGNNETCDSVKLKASGEYTLKGKGLEENLYLLVIDKQPAALLINDNVALQVDLDNSKLATPYFHGSEASQNLYGFINFFISSDSALRVISNKIQGLAKINQADTAIPALQTVGMKEMQTLNAGIANVAKTSTHPALICYALDKARNTMELTEIQALADNAAARFKTHSGLAIIKSQVAQAIAAQQQQQQNPSGSYPLLNQQAPDLTMDGADGKPLSISSFKGKYVLVDFWASWCGPCRGENPNVVAAYNKYKDKNFTILGVSLDEKKDLWLQAIKKDGLAWNHMSDLKYWQSAAVSTYQFDGIPFNVLIDPTGKIIASSLRGPALQQKLGELLH